MKKLIILSLLIAGQVAAWGQTLNIYMKDGRVIQYDASGVDYLNFTAGSVAPVEHEAVDLGLPSGLKWATCNIGATKPEETGYFFSWGEVEVKEEYGGSNYKWRNSNGSMTKYSINEKSVLEPEDDAAHVLWGESWRIPGKLDVRELINNCKRTAVTQNGVDGYLFTGPNGNSIFFPICGFMNGTNISSPTRGYYWTRNVDSARASRAEVFNLHDNAIQSELQVLERWYGVNIRPVADAGK